MADRARVQGWFLGDGRMHTTFSDSKMIPMARLTHRRLCVRVPLFGWRQRNEALGLGTNRHHKCCSA